MNKCNLLLFIVGVMCYSCVAQNITHVLWVNSASGLDNPTCGLNNTSPCNSLNQVLARGFEIAAYQDILEIHLQANITKEDVNFVDEGLKLKHVILLADENSKVFIVDSDIRIITKQVSFNGTDVVSSSIRAFGASLRGVNVNGILLEGVPLNSKDSFFSIIDSHLVNTNCIFGSFEVHYSSFYNSTVQSRVFPCYAKDSTFSFSSRLTVTDCHVVGSTFTQNEGVDGGAIYATQRLIVENSLFTFNHATSRGGAIYSVGEVVIYNTTLANNNAATGGGIYVNNGTATQSFTCQESKISNNTAVSGGGIYLNKIETLYLFPTCRIHDNSASQQGGGIYAIELNSIGILQLPVVHRNSAVQGGGVYLNNCHHYIVAGEFANNTATKEGSALYVENTANLEINEVSFEGTGTVSVVALYDSSGDKENWLDISFVGATSDSAFFCNDCGKTCAATKNCSVDCEGACIAFPSKEICFTTKCFGSSSCSHITNKNPKCINCPSGHDGDLCDHVIPTPAPAPNSGLPVYAIVLIAVGCVLILAAVALVIRKKYLKPTNEYKPLLK